MAGAAALGFASSFAGGMVVAGLAVAVAPGYHSNTYPKESWQKAAQQTSLYRAAYPPLAPCVAIGFQYKPESSSKIGWTLVHQVRTRARRMRLAKVNIRCSRRFFG